MKLLKPQLLEKDIQRQVIEWLNYHNFYAFRFNSGMISTGEGKTKRMVKLGEVGMPDVLAVKQGQFYGFEIKRPGKEPTFLQNLAHEKLRNYGAKVYTIHSVEELMAILGT